MLVNLLLWALFGAVAGWIAGKLMGGGGGLILNIVLGVIGSFVGGFLAGLAGINYGDGFNIGSLLVAVAGACVVILLVRLIRK